MDDANGAIWSDELGWVAPTGEVWDEASGSWVGLPLNGRAMLPNDVVEVLAECSSGIGGGAVGDDGPGDVGGGCGSGGPAGGFGFGPGALERHLPRHFRDTAATTTTEYLDLANGLIGRAPFRCQRFDKTMVYYDPFTNEFALTSGKYLITYYEPTGGFSYFVKVVIKSLLGQR